MLQGRMYYFIFFPTGSMDGRIDEGNNSSMCDMADGLGRSRGSLREWNDRENQNIRVKKIL